MPEISKIAFTMSKSLGAGYNLLLQYFYRSLDSINKAVADQLVRGDIMKQSFEVASSLFDELTKMNRAWYAREDDMYTRHVSMTKEQDDRN